MTSQQLLTALKMHLPDAEQEETLLLTLLDDAAALMCALTWRTAVPDVLQNAQVRLAVVLYNRLGMEGEREHAEGDVRRTADDLPEGLKRDIFSYRRAVT